MTAIGFVGLGHMGGNMAARFLAAGYHVYGERASRDTRSGSSTRDCAGSIRRARSPTPRTSSSPRFPTTRWSSPSRAGPDGILAGLGAARSGST